LFHSYSMVRIQSTVIQQWQPTTECELTIICLQSRKMIMWQSKQQLVLVQGIKIQLIQNISTRWKFVWVIYSATFVTKTIHVSSILYTSPEGLSTMIQKCYSEGYCGKRSRAQRFIPKIISEAYLYLNGIPSLHSLPIHLVFLLICNVQLLNDFV